MIEWTKLQTRKNERQEICRRLVGSAGRLVVLAVAVNILTDIFKGYVDLYLGGKDIVITKTEGSEDWESEYYSLDYTSTEEVQAAAALVEEIKRKGIVLLNNNGALPLASSAKITLLDRDAADPVYGGSGSGSVDLSSVVDLRSGLEQAGFSVNPAVYDILAIYASLQGGDDRPGHQLGV